MLSEFAKVINILMNMMTNLLSTPGWASYVVQQAHHLGIALESDGPEPNGKYPLHDMVDIWLAANATKSDVIGLWWGPTPELSLFRGTGSDLIPVSFGSEIQCYSASE